MSYTVTWKPSAKAKLAEIWIAASDRTAITAAVSRIDALLRVNPGGQGESRAGISRIFIASPLAVVYDLREDDRVVNVLSVRALRERK